jgi:hypothetical protein
MAKYLRRLGHRVTVLTTSAYGSTAATDPDVARSADLRLLSARLRRGRIRTIYSDDTATVRRHPLTYLTIPDRVVVSWVPFALGAALRLHAQRHFDAVVTTSPPQSAHFVGRALSAAGCGWVADLRDGWTFESVRPPFATAFQRRVDACLERRTLRAADVVTCVSKPVADDLRARLQLKATIVPNGFDPELGQGASDVNGGAEQQPSSDRVSIVYTGRFGGPGRDPRPLVAALRELATTEPRIAERLELVIAGPLLAEERRELAGLDPILVSVRGLLPTGKALALQRSADALLLLASPVRTQLANLKLFEYLGAERPILGIAEGTEAGRILERAGVEVACADDRDAIKATFRRTVAGEVSTPDRAVAREYSYPAVAERMAAAIERAIAARGPDR